MAKVNRFITAILIALLRSYQWVIRPILGNCCRFEPSCSNYAIEAAKNHSPLFSFWLIVRRLIRCHPWCPGGYDPVPMIKECKLS